MNRIAAAVVLAIVAALGGVSLDAQNAPAPAFEVTSVKPSNPDAPGPFPGMPAGMPMMMPTQNGRLTGSNLPLRLLVRTAYALEDFQIIGGPDWQLSRKFDITAKAEDPAATPQAMMSMLKGLLADRFKLKTHSETRELPVYELVLARNDGKLGPNMKPSTAECADPAILQKQLSETIAKGDLAAAAALAQQPGQCGLRPLMGAPATFGFRATGQPIATLTMLLRSAMGRTIVDKTGLTGLYDWEMKFDPEVFMRMASQLGMNLPMGNMPQSDSPSLMTAIQQDLGLKLNSARGPVEVLVIDSAELPTPD